jgi:hypothetical protein
MNLLNFSRNSRKRQSHAQYREDLVICEYFGQRVGRFLDLSAGDGITLSNTRLLYETGWSGVMVDGDPIQAAKLIERYGQDERISIVSAFISLEQRGLMNVHHCPTEHVTTLVDDWVRRCDFASFTNLTAAVCHLDDLLASFPGPYEFANIDVEGMSIPIALEIARRICPEMLCVEHEGTPDSICRELNSLGYTELRRDEGNLIVVRAAASHQ